MGIAPFFLDDVLIPARRMSVAALERGLRRLYQSDRTLKSARIEPDLYITRLVRQPKAESAWQQWRCRPWRPGGNGGIAQAAEKAGSG